MPVSISGAGSISGLDQGFYVTTGKVGIGTNIITDNSVFVELVADSSQVPRLQFDNKPVVGTNNGEVGSILFRNNTDSVGYIICKRESAADDGYIQFGTQATGGGVTERLRIDSVGRLLLGTTTEGAVNADNFTVADSGNCGITIRSGTSNSGNLYFSDATSGTAEFDGAIAYEQTDSRMMFFTASTERLRITSGGFVNIGADYTQTSRKVMINGGSNVGQLEVKGTEADIWMTSNGPSGGSVWRVMGAVGNTTHRWRVYDSTNSRDCINVYNDGSVVTPVQPRFWARRSTDQTSYDGRNVGGTWIKYDVEEYDIGGNFATSGSDQGRFIAPVSGLYLFQAAAYKQTGTTDWSQAWFDVDGSRKNGTDWVFDASRFAQNSIQIYLTAGQKIGFHPYNNVSGNTILDSQNHTWFKGCLLG